MSLMSEDMPCILASWVWWSRSKQGSVVAERILDSSSRQWSQSFLGTIRFSISWSIHALIHEFRPRTSSSKVSVALSVFCGIQRHGVCEQSPLVFFFGSIHNHFGWNSFMSKQKVKGKRGVTFLCHGYGTRPTIGCCKHLGKLVSTLWRGIGKLCVSKQGMG